MGKTGVELRYHKKVDFFPPTSNKKKSKRVALQIGNKAVVRTETTTIQMIEMDRVTINGKKLKQKCSGR